MINSNGKNISIIDIVIYACVVVFCFFTFNHPDILHTGGSSFTYLNGHWLDFYDANVEPMGGNAYLPSTYILFALWNLPIYLLGWVTKATFYVGGVIFWYKTLTTIFFIGTAFYMYKIGLNLGLDKHKAKMLMAFWMSSPLLVFSQFIFGQYDIFTVFFMMMGFYYYLEKRMCLFVLFFAIAATFKYFPLFIFVPLVFFAEKRIKYILLMGVAVALPCLLEVAIYIHSTAFVKGVFGFGAANMLRLTTGKIFMVLWLIFCVLMFFKKYKNELEYKRWAIYIPVFVTGTIFSAISWNPQWFLLLTPFFAISTFCNKRFRFFAVLDIVMMFFFVGSIVIGLVNWVDQSLLGLGVLNYLNADILANTNKTLELMSCNISIDPKMFVNTKVMMKDYFFVYGPIGAKTYVQLLVVCLLANVILKLPIQYFSKWSMNFSEIIAAQHIGYTRARFIVGIAIFVVPALACLLIN